MKRVLALTLTLASFATVAHADVIVPSSLTAVEGNSNNGFPFNISAFGHTSQRYQQVYLSSEFDSAFLITGMTFRPDAVSGGAFASVLPSIQIDLSTTLAGPDSLSATFASNVGGDVTTVFSGALALSSAFTGPVGGPKAFDISIVFTTPFLYDPSLGNLLFDVRNFGGGFTTQFDAHLAGGDPISRNYSLGGGVGSASGVLDTSGLVTKFQTQAVPEPAAVVLLSGGLLYLRSRRRQRF